MTAPTQARSYNYQAIEDAWTKGKIAVLDSMPGSGKTTAITDYLRKTELNHVIFVSPFKSEVEQELPKRKLKGLHYVHPRSGKGGKVTQLKELMAEGDKSSGNQLHRITCTHSAFTRLTSESFDQLGHYTLVIDETLDVIRQLDDVGLYTEYMLLGRGGFSEDSKHYQLNDQDWFDELHKVDKQFFETVSTTSKSKSPKKDFMFKLCQIAAHNQLYRYSKGKWFCMLPIELLTKAKRVIIMTHGFENSFMHCWLKIHNVEHHYIDNEKLGLVPEVTLKQELKSNLKLIELTKKLNDLAETRNYESFTKSHWDLLVDSKEIEDLKASLNHIVKEKLCADTSNIFWTCPKGHRTEVERLVPKLRGKVTLQKPLEIADVNEDFIEDDDIAESDEEKGKTHSSWLPCNIKARNDFGHITNCLYAFSLNPPPLVLNLLVKTSGISAKKINATFKLNNLLQFIYRGSIREKQPMNLCIIPADTRALLDDFLKHY
jgi:hypothetical protein